MFRILVPFKIFLCLSLYFILFYQLPRILVEDELSATIISDFIKHDLSIDSRLIDSKVLIKQQQDVLVISSTERTKFQNKSYVFIVPDFIRRYLVKQNSILILSPIINQRARSPPSFV